MTRDPAGAAGSLPGLGSVSGTRAARCRLSASPTTWPSWSTESRAAHPSTCGFDGWTADEIRSIAAPTFLVIGDRDFVRLDHAAEMLDLFPDCRFAVLPATRHTEVMQRTDELRALVGPFLS